MGQGYVFTGICDSVNRGKGGTSHPQEQTPPQSRHPPRATPPWSRHPPPQSRNPHPPRADTPPGSRQPPPEQTHPGEHAVRYGQRAGGTHPTGMQSCFLIQLCCKIPSDFTDKLNKQFEFIKLLAGCTLYISTIFFIMLQVYISPYTTPNNEKDLPGRFSRALLISSVLLAGQGRTADWSIGCR